MIESIAARTAFRTASRQGAWASPHEAVANDPHPALATHSKGFFPCIYIRRPSYLRLWLYSVAGREMLVPNAVDYEALITAELDAASASASADDRKRHLDQAASYAADREKILRATRSDTEAAEVR